jgi:hypothetical protein
MKEKYPLANQNDLLYHMKGLEILRNIDVNEFLMDDIINFGVALDKDKDCEEKNNYEYILIRR